LGGGEESGDIKKRKNGVLKSAERTILHTKRFVMKLYSERETQTGDLACKLKNTSLG